MHPIAGVLLPLCAMVGGEVPAGLSDSSCGGLLICKAPSQVGAGVYGGAGGITGFGKSNKLRGVF